MKGRFLLKSKNKHSIENSCFGARAIDGCKLLMGVLGCAKAKAKAKAEVEAEATPLEKQKILA